MTATAEETRVLERTVPFEIVRSKPDGDGLTFEGYAAVFDSPARIDSWEGEFDEVIVRGAFADSLTARMPVLMFNHGKHPLIGDMPLGVITEAREDDKGLLVRARLTDNWLIQPVRDAVRDGAISGMSFRMLRDGLVDRWERRGGLPDLRTLLKIPVPELGPVVFPAYEPTTASIRSLVESLPDLDRTQELERDLEILRRRGADQSLIDELRAAGPSEDGRALIASLLKEADTDPAGESDARSADRGDTDEPGPEGGESEPTPEQRRDHDALRLRGVTL